jgi:hypothetical protein
MRGQGENRTIDKKAGGIAEAIAVGASADLAMPVDVIFCKRSEFLARRSRRLGEDFSQLPRLQLPDEPLVG